VFESVKKTKTNKTKQNKTKQKQKQKHKGPKQDNQNWLVSPL
jgi:hypothetical protein